jgi:general secretion pathway protein M
VSGAALASLQSWYSQREPREQRILLLGGIAAVAIIIVAALLLLRGSVDAAQSRVERKQQDLAFLQSGSAEVLAAGPVRGGGASSEPIVVVVDRAAREAGLAESLGSSEAVPPNGLRVRFNAASFDALVGMTARLAQQQGIAVTAAAVERTAEPGRVNATLTLRSSATP